MALNADHLATLRAIVDTGSFEDAAAELRISPSAVSQRIRALENTIGTIVVHRSTPATATPVGEKLVQMARQTHLLEAEILSSLGRSEHSTELGVAVNVDSLATWFKAVIEDAAGWGWGLNLRLADESETLTLLRQGDVLGAVTTASKPVSGCVAHALGSVTYIPLASPWLVSQYRAAEEENTLDWTLPMLRSGPRDRVQDDYINRFGYSPRLVSNIPTSQAFLDAALSGLGWGLFPVGQGEPFIRSGELVDLRRFIPAGVETEMHTELHWQCWKLQSEPLQILTESVLAAADEGLTSTKGGTPS